jgi:hypothetical protein
MWKIGEIDRFNDAKKLVAFAGIDPSVYSSGKFTAPVITKYNKTIQLEYIGRVIWLGLF